MTAPYIAIEDSAIQKEVKSGGDVPYFTDLSTQAMWFGLLIDRRLKYNDPALSFRACERHPFSLLQGREIRYEIKVQSTVEEKWQIFSTGVLSKEFGVTKKSAKSQIPSCELFATTLNLVQF
ncbi:UNVERIFIED_CONTAM: hypothetical protein FKN15_031356 [Acipenser sinensis]